MSRTHRRCCASGCTSHEWLCSWAAGKEELVYVVQSLMMYDVIRLRIIKKYSVIFDLMKKESTTGVDWIDEYVLCAVFLCF